VPGLAVEDHLHGSTLAQQATRPQGVSLLVISARRDNARRAEDGPPALAFAVPAEIGQLTNLTGLGLGGNRLTALPPEFSQLTKPPGTGARRQSAHRAATGACRSP
jgi:Leucine-rich repeat (LRR) protein